MIWSCESCQCLPTWLFSIQIFVFSSVKAISITAFCTKIEGWGLRSRCMIFRWSFSKFWMRIVEEIISREVPKW